MTSNDWNPPKPFSFSGPSVVYPLADKVGTWTNNAVYVMTRLPVPYGPQQPQVWNTVDLTSFGVPADADSVLLSGIIIITHGYKIECADLRIGFRRFGSDDDAACENYIMQVIEASVGNGMRSTAAARIPLSEGKFQFHFIIPPDGGGWPK